MELYPAQVRDARRFGQRVKRVEHLHVRQEVPRQVLPAPRRVHADLQPGRQRPQPLHQGLGEVQRDQDQDFGHQVDCTTASSRARPAARLVNKRRMATVTASGRITRPSCPIIPSVLTATITFVGETTEPRAPPTFCSASTSGRLSPSRSAARAWRHRTSGSNSCWIPVTKAPRAPIHGETRAKPPPAEAARCRRQRLDHPGLFHHPRHRDHGQQPQRHRQHRRRVSAAMRRSAPRPIALPAIGTAHTPAARRRQARSRYAPTDRSGRSWQACCTRAAWWSGPARHSPSSDAVPPGAAARTAPARPAQPARGILAGQSRAGAEMRRLTTCAARRPAQYPFPQVPRRPRRSATSRGGPGHTGTRPSQTP